MVEFKKTQMAEEQMVERKLMLQVAKISKDDTDLQLKLLETQLDSEIPSKLIQEDIENLRSDIEGEKVIDKFGNEVDASEVDIEVMKITLGSLEDQLKADLPMRKLRNQISNLRASKKRIDAPENQIKKLEKEIRTGELTEVSNRAMPGVQ